MTRLLINLVLLFLPRLLPKVLPYLLLVWRLTFDRRVSIFLRALVPLALLYALSPFDLIKDNIPLIGRMDDLILLGLATLLLVKLSPPTLVDEHLGRRPRSNRPEDKDPSQVVDGQARFLDE